MPVHHAVNNGSYTDAAANCEYELVFNGYQSTSKVWHHWPARVTNWCLCCATTCTAQCSRVYQVINYKLNVTVHRCLREEAPEVPGRLFRKSPAVNNCAQPVDTTLLCHRVTSWARLGAFWPFRSPVLLRGTLYGTSFFTKETAQNGTICELLNTLSAVEMLHDSALFKSKTDTDTDTDLLPNSWFSTSEFILWSCKVYLTIYA